MRRRVFNFLAVFLLVFLLVPAPCAQTAEPVDLEMVARIREEAFQRSQVAQLALVLTQMGPRLTGSPALERATQWAGTRFADWELHWPRLDPWEGFQHGWANEALALRLTTPEEKDLNVLAHAWSPGLQQAAQAPAVHVVAGENKHLRQYRGRLAGAVVFYSYPEPKKGKKKDASEEEGGDEEEDEGEERPRRLDEAALEKLARPVKSPRLRRSDIDRYRKMVAFEKHLREFMAREKALVLVHANPRKKGDPISFTYSSWEPGEAYEMPIVVMARDDFDHITGLLAARQAVTLHVDIRNRLFEAPPLYNVLADIRGSDKRKEVVMLGAHLDSVHVGQGATDNAAGVAVVMEAMRILKALGVQPRRTIRAALWTGEEQGLLGSEYYVAKYFARRTGRDQYVTGPGYHEISGYFNVDNGSGRLRGVYLQDNEAVRPIFEAWMEPLRDLGVVLASPRATYGSDHASFDYVGIPGFQFVQDPLDYFTLTHHTRHDTFDKLEVDDLRQAAAVLAVFVYHAAMRDERLPRKSAPRTEPKPELFPEFVPDKE